MKWLGRFDWLHLFRFENGGGGKVYEGFVRKEDDNTHGLNVDHRYYADSEYYVKNDQRKLSEIHRCRVEALFSKYAKELLGEKVEVSPSKYTEVPEFDNLTEDKGKREKLKTYWYELNQVAKPFS